MLLEIFIVTIMVFGALGQGTPTTDTELLANLIIENLNQPNNYVFDGPSSISSASTTSTKTLLPKLEKMRYYNYYTASIYCTNQLNDLSCDYCQQFKNDVDAYTVITNNITDTVALITVSNSRREIVVTYRGTSNIWNVILDADLFNVNYPGGPSDIRMHQGFYIATMSLYNEVVTNVGYLQSRHPKFKIVILGHSLGGAMARLTEYFLLYLNQFPLATYEIYTYGEPRVGNRALADFMNRQSLKTARIVWNADVVPHVPPTSVLATRMLGDFYIHSQKEYWVSGNSSKFCDKSVYEDRTCSDSLDPTYTIPDHLHYFDLDYGTCFLTDPLAVLAIPDVVSQPSGITPPLPTKLSDFSDAASNFIVNLQKFHES